MNDAQKHDYTNQDKNQGCEITNLRNNPFLMFAIESTFPIISQSNDEVEKKTNKH
jgi:hypothetical protein